MVLWGLTIVQSAPAPPGARLKVSRPRKLPPEEDSYRAPVASCSPDLPMEIGPEKRMVRDQKRGKHAWEVVRARGVVSAPELDRLLVHSVSDETALRSYLPAVRTFVQWADRFSPCIHSYSELDRVVTIYLTAACYHQDLHPLQGALLMNGLAYLMPELSRSLPRAWRASKAWTDLSIVREGQPLALQTLACMEKWLRLQKSSTAAVAADMIFTAVDGYFREQDLLSLRASDVSV